MPNQANILVIDDEQIMRDGCSRILSKDGWAVLTAENGKLGLDQIQTNPEKIDVILLDIMMPQMTGWEVFDRIKKDPIYSTIPIIFLTARTDRIAKNAGSFLGDDYVEKPFDIYQQWLHLWKDM
jgi:CheY-like chemotaxis protein